MRLPLLCGAIALVALAGCKSDTTPKAASDGGGKPKRVTIGWVAKSQSNMVFQAAAAGARDAAKELGAKYGVEVVIEDRTPADEDATKQAQAVEQLARSGAKGIAVACSDANLLTTAIDKATDLGSTVVCFDSDAPRSKRLCYYGTDDAVCGAKVLDELARTMGGKGTIAILAGNQSAPNLQARVAGVKEALKKYPEMKLLDDGVFYHAETPEKAAEKLNTAQRANPAIAGWALIGGWPLFTKDALQWEPGSIKVVSVDALPAQLSYLTSGHVETLYAQDCYGWGYKSVELLLAKVLDKQDPASVKIIDDLTPVTKATAPEFAKKWDKWLGKP